MFNIMNLEISVWWLTVPFLIFVAILVVKFSRGTQKKYWYNSSSNRNSKEIHYLPVAKSKGCLRYAKMSEGVTISKIQALRLIAEDPNKMINGCAHCNKEMDKDKIYRYGLGNN